MIRAYAAREKGGKLEPFDYDPGILADEDVEIAVEYCGICHSDLSMLVDILAAVKRTAIPHHATFLGWSLNGVDASQEGYCYLSGSLMPSSTSILSVRMPSGHFEQVEKISCSTLFPRKFYSFKAEFEVFSERNPLLSVVKVQFLAWLSLFPL